VKLFCICSVKDDGMTIEVCPHPCGTDHDTVCVPKCCDLDKVLDGFNGDCQFSDLRWTPILYDPNSSNSPILRGGKSLLPPGTPIRSQNSSAMEYKYEIRKFDCGPEEMDTWSLRNLTRFGFINRQYSRTAHNFFIFLNM